MSLSVRAAAAVLLLASPLWAGSEPPAVRFARPPAAARTAEGVRIDFAVSAPTDVAVYVEDAAGNVVCHLVAGVLGQNPPAPLKADSLAQSILWDGKDDWGKPAAGGPFQVRVALGTIGRFDRFLDVLPAQSENAQLKQDNFILYSRDGSGRITSVAVGPGGTLYAFHLDGTANGAQGGYKLKVYSRQGKHKKALTPFPADLPAARVKGVGAFQDADGSLVPHVQNYETLSFYPDNVGVRGRDMPEWSSPAVDSKGRIYWMVAGPCLATVDADGGIPYERFLGPALAVPDVGGASRPCLAVSSDDRSVYLAGLGTPCVYRVPADTRGPAEVFLGNADRPGKEKNLLTNPRGLAVAGGRIYVADFGADRVVLFNESDGAYVGQIPVKAPDTIGVDPPSGAVYVLSYATAPAAELVKLHAPPQADELHRMPLIKTYRAGAHRIAVDASARPVQVWMPDLPIPGRLRGWGLKCIQDTGERFVDHGDPRGPDLGLEGPRDLTMDRLRDEIYVKFSDMLYYRLDERTCRVKAVLDLRVPNMASAGTQLLAGADGNLYSYNMSFSAVASGLWRFDRNGKPLNWPDQDKPYLPLNGPRSFQLRHMAFRPFAPTDEIYVTFPSDQITGRPEDDGMFYAINVIGLDGRPKRTVIWQCQNKAIPRVDRWGNVYVADLVKPPDRSYPEFFDDKMPPPPALCNSGDLYWNSHMYGSVLKFPPSGGIIWFQKTLTGSCVGEPPAELLAKPKVPFRMHAHKHPLQTGEVQGALWIRFGYSPYASRVSPHTSHCACEGSGFDVDSFGRVFYPNGGQFRVEMIDTNNNWIGSFGQYGNEDSGGPGATVKNPEIPLAWPAYVAVSDTHAYVADTVNRRVVRVRLAHAAQETCPVP